MIFHSKTPQKILKFSSETLFEENDLVFKERKKFESHGFFILVAVLVGFLRYKQNKDFPKEIPCGSRKLQNEN